MLIFVLGIMYSGDYRKTNKTIIIAAHISQGVFRFSIKTCLMFGSSSFHILYPIYPPSLFCTSAPFLLFCSSNASLACLPLSIRLLSLNCPFDLLISNPFYCAHFVFLSVPRLQVLHHSMPHCVVNLNIHYSCCSSVTNHT